MKRRDFPIIHLAPREHTPSATPDQIEARAQHVMPFEWRRQQLELAAHGRYWRWKMAHFCTLCGSEDEADWVVGCGHNVD